MNNKRKCEDDNVSLDDLKKDTYIPRLSKEDVNQIMDYDQEDRHNGLAEKLLKLKIDYEFENEFGGNVCDRELSRLSVMYRNDIEKIKDHILYTQANVLVTYIKKGYMNVEDI